MGLGHRHTLHRERELAQQIYLWSRACRRTLDHVQEQSPQYEEQQPDAIRDKEIFASEKHWERPRISSDSYGLRLTASGVNVQQAEKDFAELSRELSAISRRISRTQSRASGARGKDVEKAVSSSDGTSEDAFDLETTLRGARDADSGERQ